MGPGRPAGVLRDRVGLGLVPLEAASDAGGAGDGGAIRPRWATWGERAQLVVLYAAGTAFFWWLFGIIGSYGRLTEAWILTGSILATYGMARGWVEFWLIWIAVDAVGVPTLLDAGFYPSAVLYGFYGLFCVVGFITWLRVGAGAPRRPARARRSSRWAHDDVDVRFDTVERAVADDRGRPRGRRGRRRGPRERGRPDLRRVQGDVAS